MVALPRRVASTLESKSGKLQVVEESCKSSESRILVDEMGPASANMLDRVTLEASNSGNPTPELSWKTVTKGKRSKKHVARNVNDITKVGNRNPKKLDGSVTRKVVRNGADHIPPKKRRVLRHPSETQSSARLTKEDPLSPQPQTPSPHGDSKPRSKGFSKSSDVNSRDDRASVPEDLDQKLYNPDDFSGIALLAAAASIEGVDDAGHFKVIEEHSMPEKAGMFDSREPMKCSVSMKPQSSQIDMVKESTDTKCSYLCNGAALRQIMQVNEDVVARELEASRVNRLHWDLNIMMDDWEQPLDISDHNLEVQKLEGEGCKVSAKSDCYLVAENSKLIVQKEQINSGAANAAADTVSQGMLVLDVCPRKSLNNSVPKFSPNLDSPAVQSLQVSCVDVVEGPPATASGNISIERNTANVTSQPIPLTDVFAVLETSQQRCNINSVVPAFAEETAPLPDNSGNNSLTQQPVHVSTNAKDFSTSGASSHFVLYNPKGQTNSPVVEGAALPFLSAKDDGSQSYDPASCSAKVGSSCDDSRISDVSQGDGSNTVGSKNMTGLQDGDDSPYEDGELRLSIPCEWEENELDYGDEECVDYDSDGADCPGSEVVEAGSVGSIGVEKQSLSVREASVSKLTLNMKEDIEVGGIMAKSKVEYFMGDNNLRRRSFRHLDGTETKGSHLEGMTSITNRVKSQSCGEGSECLDGMDKTNTGYLQQNNRSPTYSRHIREDYPRKFMGKQRSPYYARERNAEDGHWGGHWGSRNNMSSDYNGSASHSYYRPRNMIAESEKFSGVNSQGHKQSMYYSSKASYRVDDRRLPYEMDDYNRVHSRRPANIDRSSGNSGSYPQGVSRGNRNDSYDPSHEKRTLSSSRMPRYLPRRDPSHSPPPSRVSHSSFPRRRSLSRSRSRSPHGGRRYTRSPDFKSAGRMDRERMPFQKPSFPADHPGSARGRRYSPHRNRRWVDDRNFVENLRHRRSSPVSASERITRFNSIGNGAYKEDGYFRPGNRPGRFPPVAGVGRRCNFGAKYDDRRNDRVDVMPRTGHSDANDAFDRCKHDLEGSFDGNTARKDDGVRSTEHRDVARARSSHEDRRSFKV